MRPAAPVFTAAGARVKRYEQVADGDLAFNGAGYRVRKVGHVGSHGLRRRRHGHHLLRERCLLFVACTRARDHLYVSYAGEPSPLLPY